jgi:NAD(P)H-hydrate epimerase
MVRVITHKSNKSDILKACPGAMLLTYDKECIDEEILNALNWCDVLAFGPGMGFDEITLDIFKLLLGNLHTCTGKPIVIDADAINFLSKNKEYLWFIKDSDSVVFTPHMKELSRLLNKSILEIRENLIEISRAFSSEWGCTLVCKDARTLVLDEKIPNTFINQAGNDGMATAGSGDVLTGMIAALICLDKNAFNVARNAVHMHGMAGDVAYKKYKRGLIASDIVDAIHEVI